MLNPSERYAAVEQFLHDETDEAWAQLRSVLLDDMPVRVIVTIDGGNYQGAVATGPVQLEILDYDNWRACDEGHEGEPENFTQLESEVENLKNNPNALLF